MNLVQKTFPRTVDSAAVTLKTVLGERTSFAEVHDLHIGNDQKAGPVYGQPVWRVISLDRKAGNVSFSISDFLQ